MVTSDSHALSPKAVGRIVREVIAAHGLSASKALGQNFLFDEQLLARIAAVPGDLSGRNVLEVGPGPGGLTRALLRAGAKVTAIEMDSRCLPALVELGEAFPGQLTVIQGDALKLDHDALFDGEPYAILSNLPYNVGTELLGRWLTPEDWPPFWTTLTLMFQREVAERIVAQPGSKAYGRLALLVQWRCEARIVLSLPPEAFTPPPKIDSAVVRLTPREPGLSREEFSALEKVTAAAFGQRRKMLRSSLKTVFDDPVAALEELGIKPTARAEEIAPPDFLRIAQMRVGTTAG